MSTLITYQTTIWSWWRCLARSLSTFSRRRTWCWRIIREIHFLLTLRLQLRLQFSFWCRGLPLLRQMVVSIISLSFTMSLRVGHLATGSSSICSSVFNGTKTIRFEELSFSQWSYFRFRLDSTTLISMCSTLIKDMESIHLRFKMKNNHKLTCSEGTAANPTVHP